MEHYEITKNILKDMKRLNRELEQEVKISEQNRLEERNNAEQVLALSEKCRIAIQEESIKQLRNADEALMLSENRRKKDNEDAEIRMQGFKEQSRLKEAIYAENIKNKDAELINIFERISDGFFALDNEWHFTYINRIMEGILDLRCELLDGRCIWEVCPNLKDNSFYDNLITSVQNNKPACFEYSNFNSDNIYEFHAYPSESGITVFVRDISLQRKHDIERIRVDRATTIAQMAAGIAHEIRNPLTTVSGLVQLMLKKRDVNEHFLELIMSELNCTTDIIKEFLSFTRPKKTNSVKGCINNVISNIVPLLKATAVQTNNKLVIDLSEVPDILLVEGEIQQLLLNLSQNGFQAMKNTGVLTIKTETIENQVILLIKDEGEGISPENLPQIGAPFFTTKENGTGLGLPICFDIANRHNAKIDITSSLQGTTVIVIFRVARD